MFEPLLSGLSVKPSLSGHLKSVRIPWTFNGVADKMNSGRENGQSPMIHVAPLRLVGLRQLILKILRKIIIKMT